MTVGELLMILRITKQSLARVLGELRREGFIVQRTDAGDRRRRRLYLAPEAEALEQTLTERQAALLARAFCEAGDTAAEGFRAVLTALVDPGDRARFVSPAQSAAIAPARSK
jgi:DNA-binding MarR family transcriptional regulator